MTNEKTFNNEKTLVDCQVPELTNSVNIDPVPLLCADDQVDSQKRVVRNPPDDWRIRATQYKMGIGKHHNCDPIQTGQISNDLDTPNRNVIYRYSKALRGANEAMLDLFSNVKVKDEDGKQHVVPIMWASQEKAVASLLQSNVRKDESLVVDRIPLPTMSLWANGHQLDMKRFTYQKAMSYLSWLDPDSEGYGFTQREKFEKDTVFGVTRGLPVDIKYTLYVWTLYQQDMDQILEQVILKFSPIAYIQVKGVYWEIGVTLDSLANNIDLEPGDNKLRVIKYQFEMTAQSYIPQPITRIEMPDPVAFAGGMSEQEINEVVRRLEREAKALEKELVK